MGYFSCAALLTLENAWIVLVVTCDPFSQLLVTWLLHPSSCFWGFIVFAGFTWIPRKTQAHPVP